MGYVGDDWYDPSGQGGALSASGNGGFALSAPLMAPAVNNGGGGALASYAAPRLTVQDYIRQGYSPDQAMQLAGGLGSNPKYIDALAKQGETLAGGPLSQQIEQIKTDRQAAADNKLKAIQQAMDVLKVNHDGQSSNLPFMAAAAGFFAPTKTGLFSESLGNALGSSIPAISQQRQAQNQYAGEESNLGIQSAGVQSDLADKNAEDFWKRIQQSDSDLRYAAASGQRADANALTNSTRLATTDENNQTRRVNNQDTNTTRQSIATGNNATSRANNQDTNTTRVLTNANTVDQKDRGLAVKDAYQQSVLVLRKQGLDEKAANDQAMLGVRQQLADLAGRNLTQKENNDFNSKVDAAEANISKTMGGMNMSPTDLRASAIANVAKTWKPINSPAAPTAGGAVPPAQQPTTKKPLSDIFN